MKKIGSDYYTIIYPDEIMPMDEPEFSVSHWYSELEYKQFLEQMQPLMEWYEASCFSFTDCVHDDDEKMTSLFENSFVDVGHRIDVEKIPSGKYRVVSNGRHRMYVAKKYKLKLLVYVVQKIHLKNL